MVRRGRCADVATGIAVSGGLNVPLSLRGSVALPPHQTGGFDHGDVHLDTGRVFVAHTANDTLEVIDCKRLELLQTLSGCPEGSGVLCTQGDAALVFAAARRAGKVLVLDTTSFELRREIPVGPKPNGLAFDSSRGHLLVADVEDTERHHYCHRAAAGSTALVRLRFGT
jgi:DNA-binding beta-propeller fold protein YncE